MKVFGKRGQKRVKKSMPMVFLFILPIVFLAAILIAGGIRGREEPSDSQGGLFPMTEEELLEFSYTDGGTRLDFVRRDGVWRESRDEGVPMLQEKIEAMMRDFLAIQSSGQIDMEESSSFYGLDDPAWTVTLRSGEQEICLLAGGDDGEGHYYVQAKEGEETLELVRRSSFEVLILDYDSLVEKDTFSAEIGIGNLLQVTISSGNSMRLYTKADAEALKTIVGGLGAMEFRDFASYNADQDKMREFGLTDPEAVVFEAVYTDENGAEKTLSLRVGGETEDGECRYVCMEDSKMVAAVSREVLANLLNIRRESRQGT